MKITWSDDALAEMRRRFGQDAGVWKLMYDSEGCGCSLDGVAALWAIDANTPGLLRADCDSVDMRYEKLHEVFFDEPLRVAYSPENRAFKLYSDSQIYTNRLKLEDRRTSEAAKGQ